MVRLRNRIAGAEEMIGAVPDVMVGSGLWADRVGLVDQPGAFRGLVDDAENAERLHGIPVGHVVEMRQIDDDRIEFHGFLPALESGACSSRRTAVHSGSSPGP